MPDLRSDQTRQTNTEIETQTCREIDMVRQVMTVRGTVGNS